jgi:hypothetical protein
VLTELLDQISEYANLVWNPTAVKFNDGLLLVACNEILGSIITNQNLEITPSNLFNLSKLGVRIDPMVYDNDEKLRFAASNFYETDINDFEKTISWMRNIGCDNVILGRGIRAVSWKEELTSTIEKYGMKVYGPLNISATTITGITMMIQHVSANDKMLAGPVNKTIVIKDSRPIEVL